MTILLRDVRASDHDRETAVALLKAHYADGRLSEDELGWRTHAAYRAEGMRELAQLTSDLPAPPRPRRRRRPPYVALGILCLLIAAWLVMVPPEVTVALVLVVSVLAMLATFLLSPLWIPALLIFVAWRVIKTR
jgi:ferric-dicitrate binding protein FerR (iron transport regulator)